MPGRPRRSEQDRRRRSLGQNFLVDQALIGQFIADLSITEGELVVDIGAGGGALTIPLLNAGAEVWAVEKDPAWADKLREAVHQVGAHSRARVIRADFRQLRFPKTPYRVVANPPFGLTTGLLGRLLDDPRKGPTRADLVVQREVARKHAATPPAALKTSTWTPWWEFTVGRNIDRSAFRPRPGVDAAVLMIRRRDPPVLPTWLAPRFGDLLRPGWQPPNPR